MRDIVRGIAQGSVRQVDEHFDKVGVESSTDMRERCL
jgi:hypothetical protein